MLKNKKGFTLIEILAAITILGILMGIAIVSVTKVIENGKKKHYTTAEANMVLAGQSYVQQNRTQLPKAIGQKKKIPLSMLVDKNYIQPIKDYSDNECNMAESYIQVFKYSQNDYSYVSYLECPNYNSQENINDMTPKINASIVIDENNNKATARIEITGNDKLMSYSYIIYRNGKEVKNTGSVAVEDFAASKSINFSLAEYTPGDIKISITATNTYGNTRTKTITEDVPDTKKPKCIIKEEDKADSPKAWITSGTRKITVGCDDGETGSGCTRDEYTKTFKDSMITGTITIEDEDGNKTNCEVSVYIDKVKPTITVKAYKKTADDKKTGSVLKTVSTTVSDNSKTINLEDLADSKWLNKADYPNGIYYELELNDNLALSTYKVDRNETGLKKDASNVNTLSHNIANTTISGKSVNKTTVVSTDGYRKTKAVITDAAGNTAEVMMITPVDRTAPSVPTISMYKWSDNSTTPSSSSGLSAYTNDTWSNKNVYTEASGSTDGMSGFKEYKYTTTGETTNNSNKVGTTRNIKAAGISYIKYKACDIAGNCSSFTSDKTIKIDKTSPTCTVTGGSTSWINASSTTTKRTITATCSDDRSGCTTATLTKDYSDNINTTTAGAAGNGQGGTVYDNAGNSVTCEANQIVKIDKTVPVVSSIDNDKNGVATIPGLQVTLNGSDSGGSGISKWQYKEGTGSWTNIANSNYSPFVQTYTTLRNATTFNYRLCDVAGNCSSASSTSIHIVDACSSTTTTWSGTWGTCSKECDTGTQTMTGTKYSTYDGSNCGTDTKSQNCNERTCCSSTTTTWSGTWDACSATCGGGTQTMSGTKYSAYDSSVSCGTDSKSQECNTQECCSSTTTTWSGTWGACSVTCGGGTQTMSGIKYSDYDGTNCGDDSKSQSCNTHSCVDYCSDASFYARSTNQGSWVNANSSWGNWCHANGTTCNASGGNHRICSSSWCDGMTAKKVNETWGCSYSKYWCTCS